MSARDALLALMGQIRREHDEVCRHLQDAQLRFLQSKPLITLATGYTGCESTPKRALDLSTLVYKPVDSDTAFSEASAGHAGGTQMTQMLMADSSSRSQRMVVQPDAGFIGDTDEGNRQVNSSLDSALHDDDDETVKDFSEDGHSYAGTVVRGVLRGDSE